MSNHWGAILVVFAKSCPARNGFWGVVKGSYIFHGSRSDGEMRTQNASCRMRGREVTRR